MTGAARKVLGGVACVCGIVSLSTVGCVSRDDSALAQPTPRVTIFDSPTGTASSRPALPSAPPAAPSVAVAATPVTPAATARSPIPSVPAQAATPAAPVPSATAQPTVVRSVIGDDLERMLDELNRANDAADHLDDVDELK